MIEKPLARLIDWLIGNPIDTTNINVKADEDLEEYYPEKELIDEYMNQILENSELRNGVSPRMAAQVLRDQGYVVPGPTVSTGTAEAVITATETALRWQLEVCICAAVVAKSGRIFRGHRHGNAIATLREVPGEEMENDVTKVGASQGFITSRNRYVTREEGRALQDAAGIPSADPGGYRYNILFSEDLY